MHCNEAHCIAPVQCGVHSVTIVRFEWPYLTIMYSITLYQNAFTFSFYHWPLLFSYWYCKNWKINAITCINMWVCIYFTLLLLLLYNDNITCTYPYIVDKCFCWAYLGWVKIAHLRLPPILQEVEMCWRVVLCCALHTHKHTSYCVNVKVHSKIFEDKKEQQEKLNIALSMIYIYMYKMKQKKKRKKKWYERST